MISEGKPSRPLHFFHSHVSKNGCAGIRPKLPSRGSRSKGFHRTSASRQAGGREDRQCLPSRPAGISDPRWATNRQAWISAVGSPPLVIPPGPGGPSRSCTTPGERVHDDLGQWGLHHASFSLGPENLSRFVAPPRLDNRYGRPRRIAAARARVRGMHLGAPRGRTGLPDREPASRALCPVRTAIRYGFHTFAIAQRWGGDSNHFPLFPNTRGEILS